MKKKLLFMAIALICSLSYSQGDTCAAASTVSCGTGEFDYISYTTSGFTDTAGNSSNDVFFTITPASVETINVDTCFTSTTRDTKITVYSDCTLSTIIAQNDIGSCGYQAKVSFSADGVSSYIIMVEGGLETPSGADGAAKNGDFEMVVWCSPLGSVPQLPQGITCNASASGPSEIFSDELDVQGNWSGDIATSLTGTANSGMWEIIAAGGSGSGSTGPDAPFSGASYMNYEGSGTSSGLTASAVSPAIDLSGTITEDAELTFYMHAFGGDMGTLEIGVGTSASGPFTTEYTWSGQYQTIETEDWVQVGVDLSGYLGQTIFVEFAHTGIGSGFQGDMSIDLVQVNACKSIPENDDCVDATPVTTLPFNETIDATTATNNSGFILDCGSGMNDGVWYTFTAAISGTIDISLSNVDVDFNPELDLYSGSCGSFTCVANSDNGGDGVNEIIESQTVVAGTTYFINVGHWDGTVDEAEGLFTIDISTVDSTVLNVENNEETIKGITLYPNPVRDYLNLRSIDQIEQISVYNLLGQQVRYSNPGNSQTSIDMASLDTGIYIVKIKAGGKTGNYKIIKE